MPVINTYLYCFPQHFLLLFKILRIIVNCNGWMILLFTASRSYITNVKLKIIIMAGFLISNKYIFSVYVGLMCPSSSSYCLWCWGLSIMIMSNFHVSTQLLGIRLPRWLFYVVNVYGIFLFWYLMHFVPIALFDLLMFLFFSLLYVDENELWYSMKKNDEKSFRI